MNRFTFAALSVLATVALASPSVGATTYDEGVSGDLSNLGTSPTALVFGLGTNQVFGSSGQANGVVDRDYFTFTVGANSVLSAIEVLPGTTAIGGGSQSFIAIALGNQTAVNPASGSAAGLLGWTHYVPGQIGTDILDNMNTTAFGASGFSQPLQAGNYTVWIQETAAGTANYRFNFQIQGVPEPGTWAMMLLGFGLVGWRIRKRSVVGAVHA